MPLEEKKFVLTVFQFPDSPTRFPEEWISIPRSPRNEKMAFLDSPIPRGMKSVGELEPLIMGRFNDSLYKLF